MKLISVLVTSFAILWMSGCVTTTTSSFDDKTDLAKAEESYIQIGYGYFEQGNLLESKTALHTALEINPRSAGAHMGLGRVYERELEYELADDHFRKAIRYDDSSEYHFQYAVFLYNRADFKGAYRQFEHVLKDTVYVRRPVSFEYQALVSLRLDQQDEAIEHFRRAISLNRTLGSSYVGLSRIYLDRQDYETGYQYFGGFINLVRSQLSHHNAATLWLGIQLADAVGDLDALASFELQLRNQYSASREYELYQAWKEENSAT